MAKQQDGWEVLETASRFAAIAGSLVSSGVTVFSRDGRDDLGCSPSGLGDSSAEGG